MAIKIICTAIPLHFALAHSFAFRPISVWTRCVTPVQTLNILVWFDSSDYLPLSERTPFLIMLLVEATYFIFLPAILSLTAHWRMQNSYYIYLQFD